MSVKGSNLSSLTLAIADLKAIDARLTALGAADPPIESDGVDLTAAIRESQALVRAAITRLSGNQVPGEAANEAADQDSSSAKRRVKIKAASEATVPASAARAEAIAPKASAKSAARGGDRARGASAAATAASTEQTPPNSLLARLGAATPEPGARQAATADGGDAPVPAPMAGRDSPSAYDTADRLARLEAEIDSLTKASSAVDTLSSANAPDAIALPAVAKPAAAQPSLSGGTAAPTSVSTHQPGVVDDGAGDDEDDAEIVIVTAEARAAGSAGQGLPPTRQSPRAYRDPPTSDDDDAEVEIVRPDAQHDTDGREARLSMTPGGERAKAAASRPAAPAKWRLFRGSR